MMNVNFSMDVMPCEDLELYVDIKLGVNSADKFCIESSFVWISKFTWTSSLVCMQIKKYTGIICLPTEHQGVHKNSFRNVCAFQDPTGIWKCWF